jgi:hypothetical protein
LAGSGLASGLGCVALLVGVAALRLRRTVSAVPIQEHSMSLEDVCAALMLLGGTLVCPVRAMLCLRATAL